MAVQQLAENLDQFDFIPGIHTPEEYGRHMIRESGHFEYDENLEGFYDYRRYGEQHIRQEGGRFNECGYDRTVKGWLGRAEQGRGPSSCKGGNYTLRPLPPVHHGENTEDRRNNPPVLQLCRL